MAADDLDTCGCCGAQVAAGELHNPPDLSALAYRIGGHGDFLRRMVARLPLESVEDAPGVLRYPLAALTTRSVDDPAVALLDAWAALGDVLTFYQERLANEGFLRTATERRSILELARLIGYELNPGVAASAHLAFTTDPAEGAPRSVMVPQGTRVQSVPGQGELPQTFETSADILARVEWNELRPRRVRPQQLALHDGHLYLLGAGATALPVGQTRPLDLDAVLPATGTVSGAEVSTIYAAGTATNLNAGDVILLAGRRGGDPTLATSVRTVQRVEEEPALDRSRIELVTDTVPPAPVFTSGVALASATFAQAAFDASSIDQFVVGQTWTESQLSAWLAVQGWSTKGTVDYVYGAYSAPKPPTPPPGAPGAFALRAKVGFFGHNAPAFASLTDRAQTPFENWDGGVSIWKDTLKPSADYYSDADCFLERTVAGVAAGSWAVFELPPKQFTAFRVRTAAESSLVGFSLSAKTTGLELAAATNGAPLADTATDKPEGFGVRRTTAHVVSERLTLAQLPIEDPLGAGTPEADQLTFDRMVLNLAPGQPLAVTGERDDLPGVFASEIVVLEEIQHAGGFTTAFFAVPGLVHRYVRATVTINANVAVATHGESVREVLGSGDGGRPNQRFVLKKPPLTYTPSAAATGATTSLEVRVDGVAWQHAERLFGSGPSDERYQVRRDEEGRTTVIFGDGVQGARLPTGVENVVASYRSGIGRAGMVKPRSLTLLMTRPLGIRDVANPLGASGAADPEPRDEARANAPLTVLAMERVVSLTDAENFSRAFAGVGKSAAVPLWRNGTRWIHLTVAAAAPAPDADGLATAMADHRVDVTSPLGRNLVDAMDAARDPSLRIRVDTYQPVFFDVIARVLVDPRYRWADVEAAIKADLTARFGFERRSFGQPVSTAEMVTAMQSTPGVIFVDLDALHRFDEAPSLPTGGLLVASPVAWPEEDPEPSLAELLLVNPLGLALTPVTPESLA